MAAGFKTATVNASDVPATLTNYPAYVDLSRLGITTLAEAQSVRVYAEEAKTTEWAREIVSASEMWVKIPSLTSTTAIYVDWDGVSADYAVTDTYGRNAVWSNYSGVYHMEGNSTDSSGSYNGTDTSMTYSTGDGYIEQGANFSGTGYITTSLGAGVNFNTTYWTGSMWIKSPNWTTYSGAVPYGNGTYGGNNGWYMQIVSSAAGLQVVSNYTIVSSNQALSNDTYYLVHILRSGSTLDMYFNGTEVTYNAHPVWSTQDGSSTVYIGRYAGGTSNNHTGDMDEVRMAKSELSANWISTEYNNQSDEAGFWGTWSTVGGGGATDNAIFAFGGF